MIHTVNRNILDGWALATEKYHRQENNLHLMGGLHDYINSLSDDQVIEYISKETNEHPEINNPTKLNSLVKQFGTGVSKKINPLDGRSPFDYIRRQNRTHAESWALATEKYHRQVNNLHLMGGLHDYIKTLTDDQVDDYIQKEVREHPEISGYDALEALVTKFGINQGTPMVASTQPLIGGGLHDVVKSLDRKSLIAYALAMDEYSHEKSPRMGGVDDYIYSLKDQEISNFILKQADQFPELNNKIAVEGLVKKYNITVRDQ